MRRGHRGFILIIVLALLGVLAFMSLSLVEMAGTTRQISHRHMSKTRSRLMARSGIEAGMAIALVSPDLPSAKFDRAVGDGTHAVGGDVYELTYIDTASCLNLNDGLEAGKLERGDSLAANATESYEEVDIIPDNGLYKIGVVYRQYCLITQGAPAVATAAKPGDILHLMDGSGNEIHPPTEIKGFSTVFLNPLTYPSIHTEVTQQSADVPWMTRIKITRRKPLGLFNLRLRHLLNAYGDVHRFTGGLGWPVWRMTDWNVGLRGSYGASFTPTSTALGNFNDPTPGLNVGGVELTIPSDVAAYSTGLGDRLISLRPPSGYNSMAQIKDVAEAWAKDFIPSSGRDTFMGRVTLDLTVTSLCDRSFSRMTREFGKRRKPVSADFKFRDHPYYDVFPVNATANMFLLQSMQRGIWDFRDLFVPHPVHPVNLTGASPWVKAAIFWAPCNVGYVAESQRMAMDVQISLYSSDPTQSDSYSPNSERYVGVSEPVFTSPDNENGASVPVTSKRFMSLRDALVTSQALVDYLKNTGRVRTFDEFREFLRWRRLNAAEYEKVQASTIPYNPHRVNGGQFTQDYAEETLPQVLGCLRRIPGYLGAPQALLSPYKELDPLRWWDGINGWEAPYGGGTQCDDFGYLLFHGGMHPAVKVEDFVSRCTLPKIMFAVGGHTRLVSRGSIRLPDGRVDAVSEVDALMGGAFDTAVLRSQSDFTRLTDVAATHASVRIGPEHPGSPNYPNAHLGVVGLRDHPEDPDGSALTVRHDFTDVTSETGPSPMNPSVDDIPLWQDGLAGLGCKGVKPHALVSGLEGGTAPFFGMGSSGCDLSPFNGVTLLSINHGYHSGPLYKKPPAAGLLNNPIWIFNDALYWRPATVLNDSVNPAIPAALLDQNLPTGKAAGKGSISLWFRVPTGDRFTGDTCNYGNSSPGPNPWSARAYCHHSRGPFHMLSCLNLWEQADDWYNIQLASNTGGPISPGRSVTLQLGYVFDNITHKGRIIGRYESRYRAGALSWPPPMGLHEGQLKFGFYNSGGINYCDYSGWPSNMATWGSNDDLLGLHDPANPGYNSWHALNNLLVGTTEIILKDIPENSPGTWHRVTFSWDCSMGSATPLKLVLHDLSNIESVQAPVIKNSISEPTNMMPWDSAMTLSLGEAHARCRMLGSSPGQSPYFVMTNTAAGDYEHTVDNYKHERYLPAWRLDSAVDNFRLYLKDQGDMTPVCNRYDVTDEPAWVLNPMQLTPVPPADATWVEVGARIFEPLDSQGNFPHVDLQVDNGGILTPLADLTIPRAAGRVTERRLVLPSSPVKNSRILLTWRNRKPDGSPLVNDGTDNWTEIPWVMEVSLRYKHDRSRILSWELR